MNIQINFKNKNYYTLINNNEIKVVFTCDIPYDHDLKIKIIDGEIINNDIVIHEYQKINSMEDTIELNSTIICSVCGTKYYRKQDECPNCHTDNDKMIDSDE